MNINNRSALSLVEMLISLSLLSVVIFSILPIELNWRRIMIESQRRSLMLNEVSVALDHMHSNIVEAIGNIQEPAVCTTVDDCTIATDYDIDNSMIRVRRIDTTPGVLTDNKPWFVYRYDTANSQIEFNGRPIASHISDLNFRISSANINIVDISVSAQAPAAGSADVIEVNATARILMPSVSTN